MTPLSWADVLTLFPACVPFGLNLFNATAWPRGEAPDAPIGTVSVLVPARNEEATIEACVRAALAQEPPVHEVIVADDHSTDRTGEILTALAAEAPRLKVIHPPELPPGWVGKPHACHHLSEAATGDVLVFVDADTRLTRDGVARLHGVFRTYRARVISAFPRQEMVTLAERLMVPILPLTFTSWMPLDLVWKHVDPRLLVANGQVLAFRREAYDAIGGFRAVRAEIVDDMAMCRRAKEHDERVVFLDGQDVAVCRMYRSASELWSGFTKNTFVGLGRSWVALAFVIFMVVAAFVLPYTRLAAHLVLGRPLLVAAIGVGFNLGARVHLARRLGHDALSVLLHPFAILAFVGIALHSAVRTTTGSVSWRGRHYARGGVGSA